MGNDIQKGTTYATGGVGGQGSITSSNLNAHVDDAIIKPTFITAKALREPGVLGDQILLESGGALYRMDLTTLKALIVLPAIPPALTVDTVPLYPGTILQTVSATPYTANTNLGTIPLDDTIPQIGEGTQILTLNITPRYSTSLIRLVFNGFGSVDASGISLIVALFRTGTANALKASIHTVTTANHLVGAILDWVDNPATTTAQTYSIRAGSATNNARMNGNIGVGRLMGGSGACTLMAQEIKG